MPIHYNLHRFGPDELAVGHLINGDFPADDVERWNISEAPSYRIKKLIDAHLRAQDALRDCRDTGRPFVLYLRSFASEHRSERTNGNFVSSHVVAEDSYTVQRWLWEQVKDKFPLIRLFGGSDTLLADDDDGGMILSTQSTNWERVAAELVEAASAIVFMISSYSAGVAKEFEFIRRNGRTQHCLVFVVDPNRTPNRGSGSLNDLQPHLADFPNVVNLDSLPKGVGLPDDLEHLFKRVFRLENTNSRLTESISAPFTYLEAHFVESEDYVITEKYIWDRLRVLRVVFDDTYWAAVKEAGINLEDFFERAHFSEQWRMAHQVYGLAIAVADFNAIKEVIAYLRLLYIIHDADMDLAFSSLAHKYSEIASIMFSSGIPDTESNYTIQPDPLNMPTNTNSARILMQQAATSANNQDITSALYFYQAALVCALRVTDSDEPERSETVRSILYAWANEQANAYWANREANRGTLFWAEVNFKFALAISRTLVSQFGKRFHPGLAQTMANLGAYYARAGRLTEADPLQAQALNIRRALAKENLVWQRDLAKGLATYAETKHKVGDNEAVISLLEESVSVYRTVVENEPPAVVDLTMYLILLSFRYAELGETVEGFKLAREAAGLLEAVKQYDASSAKQFESLLEAALHRNEARS